MNRRGKQLLTTLFLIYIFIIGIYMAISPKYEMSDVENRTLAQRPELTKKGIIDGSYMEDFEEFFTDQFPGRNVWLQAYVQYERLTNQTFIYDYYITDDLWIMPRPVKEVLKEEIDISTGNLNQLGKKLKEKGIEFYYFLIPSKANMLQFLYPDYIREGAAEEKNRTYFMSKIDESYVTAMDMIPAFKNYPKEEIMDRYFRTDHHWNMQGAFKGYKLFVEQLSNHSGHFQFNEILVQEEQYEKICASQSNTFEGSYNRQIYMSVPADTDNENMCALFPKGFSDFEVTVDGEKMEPMELYGRGLNKEQKQISYGHIFTNDKGKINIINRENADGANILVIKDSYVNPMIYHIAQSFYRTTIYDPRHTGDSVLEYIEENDFDIVAILYNSSNLTGNMYEFGT